ncbi:MAG: HupE/UreJ family protein [Saprospiraceae bacterium]
MFTTYLSLGFDHILDFKGYDHILFVIVLCAVYKVNEWKKVLILVTAFTIGHSITLAMSALDIVHYKAEVIEFLIPLTILVTAFYNVFEKKSTHLNINLNYIMALFFGFIHGLGFSNYFKALMGKEESVIMPLLAFNVGVELGQLIIVALTMTAAYVFMNLLKVRQREWIIFVSGAAAGISYILLVEAKFW